MKSSLTLSTKDKMVTWPDQGPQSFRCQPDLSIVISVSIPAVQVAAGQLDWQFYTVNGPLRPQYITSFSQIFLSAWGRNAHPSNTLVPSCLPRATFICFGTADLWMASRHAVIFPSDSIEKGKHIIYSSLGAAFIYPARNGIFLCV